MYSFFVALQFLTRLPSPIRRDVSPDDLGACIGWFPAVGVTLGLLLVGLDAAARSALHPALVDALLVVTLVGITGAFHLDGVIDTVNGLAAGPGRAERLAAMREGTVRNSGAVVGCATVFATYVAMSALPAAIRAPALLLAPLYGRTAILLAYRLYPYARPEPGLSHSLKDGATTPRALAGMGTAVALGGIAAGPAGLVLLAMAVAPTQILPALAVRRFGGITGDVCGAICESAQLVALLVAPGVLSR